MQRGGRRPWFQAIQVPRAPSGLTPLAQGMATKPRPTAPRAQQLLDSQRALCISKPEHSKTSASFFKHQATLQSATDQKTLCERFLSPGTRRHPGKRQEIMKSCLSGPCLCRGTADLVTMRQCVCLGLKISATNLWWRSADLLNNKGQVLSASK